MHMTKPTTNGRIRELVIRKLEKLKLFSSFEDDIANLADI